MGEPYLILHKVRGEPAFDVAQKMSCPICEGARQGLDHGRDYAGNCESCDDGYWWIIPTSGHRAYPYWHCLLAQFGCNEAEEGTVRVYNEPYEIEVEPPLEGLRDHYEVSGAPPPPKFNIMALISPLMPKIKRRL